MPFAKQPAHARKSLFQRLFRKKAARRRAGSVAIVGINVSVFLIVAVIVLHAPRTSAAATPLLASNANAQASTDPLDQVSSANIAETVSRLGSLPETTAITNQADSEMTELTMAPTDANVVSKPQVVATASFASNKDIKIYSTVSGDTITAVAAKFGVTSDSIRWSNNLTGDAVGAGIKLRIPPITGIVYTAQNGDTPTSLAAKFNADANKIIAYNDAEISGIKPGEQLLIPDGTIVAAVAPVPSLGSGWSGSATYGANGYDPGYCTWWVASLRAKAGDPVPSDLGNASTWALRAAALGLPTGTTPQVGAAVVTSTSGEGHVAYVTAVNSDGTITISEMNHEGYDIKDTRTLADDGFHYIY